MLLRDYDPLPEPIRLLKAKQRDLKKIIDSYDASEYQKEKALMEWENLAEQIKRREEKQ